MSFLTKMSHFSATSNIQYLNIYHILFNQFVLKFSYHKISIIYLSLLDVGD